MKRFRPLGDRILAKRIEQEERTPGGLHIPDNAKEKPSEGEVLETGPGKMGDDGTRQPVDVRRGDRILFGKYAGNDIELDGEKLLILTEEEILGVKEE